MSCNFNCSQCDYRTACIAQRISRNENECVRTIPSGRSEALNNGGCSCCGSFISFGCSCCGNR